MSASAAYAVDASSSRYATGTFPSIPRISGLASVSSGAPSALSAGATLVRLFPSKDLLQAAASAGGAGAAASSDAAAEAVYVHYARDGASEQRQLLASISGKGGKRLDGLRKAVGSVVSKAKSLKIAFLEFDVPALDGLAPAAVAGAIAQAAALSNYSFNRYITGVDKAPHIIARIHVVTGGDASADAAVATARAFSDASILARDVGNERADEMHPARMEALARSIAAETGMSVHAVVGEELLAEGMHMHYSVGQAARHPPRYIELLHRGNPDAPDDVIAIVGKGITFDTGGLKCVYLPPLVFSGAASYRFIGMRNPSVPISFPIPRATLMHPPPPHTHHHHPCSLKPTGSMEDMHLDKQG